MCAILRPFLIYFIFIALPVSADNETNITLGKIISEGLDIISNLVPAIATKSLFNINGTKLCEMYELYSKKNIDSPELRTSDVKCKEYICDRRITQIDSDIFNYVPCILGGRPVFHGEFPHMGALGWKSAIDKTKWVYLCGATLISHRFMLTAAHCSSAPLLYGVAKREPMIVQLGDKFLSNDVNYPNILKKCFDNFGDLVLANKMHRTHKGQTIDENAGPKYVSIESFLQHPDYDPSKRYYDIALIELAESLNFGPLISPACLWNNPETSSLNKVSITGWGAIHPADRYGTNELQVAEVDLIDSNTCDELLKLRHSRKWDGLSDHQICGGMLEGGVDTCRGDSGGPLQVKMNFVDKLSLPLPFIKWPMYYQVAVTSFSFKCGRPKTPSIYTKTASFIDWIEGEVWP